MKLIFKFVLKLVAIVHLSFRFPPALYYIEDNLYFLSCARDTHHDAT